MLTAELLHLSGEPAGVGLPSPQSRAHCFNRSSRWCPVNPQDLPKPYTSRQIGKWEEGRQMRRFRSWWLLAVLSGAFPVLPGCITSGQHVPACPEPLATALDLPAGCRHRVYFFLVGDLHPCHDLESLRCQLIDAGYIKVYCGKFWHLHYFTKELKKIHQDDEEARFVIVSQGGAAKTARELANRAGEAGVAIDVFVYLDEVKDLAPAQARQVIAIHGDGVDACGAGAATEYTLADAGLKGAAGHPQTLKILLHYLEPVTTSVPLIDHDPVPPGQRDGWDFLKCDGNDTGCCDSLPTLVAPGAPPASMHGPK
jgi:hypothetical protein